MYIMAAEDKNNKSISEPISIKFGILIFRPNLVVCAKFHTIRADITHLVHNKKQIGRRYIWELYLNFDQLPWAKKMICAKFHLDRAINETCTLFPKIHGQTDGRTDMHKSTQKVILCRSSKGTMGLSRFLLPVTNKCTKT